MNSAGYSAYYSPYHLETIWLNQLLTPIFTTRSNSKRFTTKSVHFGGMILWKKINFVQYFYIASFKHFEQFGRIGKDYYKLYKPFSSGLKFSQTFSGYFRLFEIAFPVVGHCLMWWNVSCTWFSVKLNGGRHVTGVLRGFDPFMNLVLDEAVEEVSAQEKHNIGMVVSNHWLFVMTRKVYY